MCINRQLVAHAPQLPHIHTCQSFPITLRHTSSVTCHVSREHHLPLINTSLQNSEISPNHSFCSAVSPDTASAAFHGLILNNVERN